jgi:protein gp37
MATLPKVLISRADYQIGGGVALRLRTQGTDHTFNLWIGCQHVSPGCDHCHAERFMATWLGKVEWGAHGKRKRTSAAYWKNPIKWNAEARAFKREHGHRPRVFCAPDAADVFDNQAALESAS